MHLALRSLVLAFVMASVPAVHAVETVAQVSPQDLQETARHLEVDRRQVLAAHVSWEWVVAVKPAAMGATQPEDGLLMGMRNGGSEGKVSSIGWFSTDGQMRWLAVSVPGSSEKEWRLAEMGNEEVQKITDTKVIQSKINEVVGAPVSLDTLQAWVLGMPSLGAWPQSYAQEKSVPHPSTGQSDAGPIHWTLWEYVSSSDGGVVPVPAAWTIASPSGPVEFAMQTYEARGVGGDTEKGWPFVKPDDGKSAATKPAKGPSKEPVIRPEDLDYQSW